MKKKHTRKIAAALAVLLAALTIYTFPLIKAVAVMGVVSSIEIRDGSLQKGAVDVRIPGGWRTLKKDWFPMMLTFDADGLYRRITGTDDTHMTVFNPEKPLMELISGIAASEGLFAWQPPQK